MWPVLKQMWRFIGERVQTIFFKFMEASKKVNLSKWLLLRSVFFTKDLNNSHLERFNAVCTPFPMERHMCDVLQVFEYTILYSLIITKDIQSF